MKRFNADIKKIIEIIDKDDNITIRAELIGNHAIKRSFGKYKIIDNNQTVKKINNTNIKNVRIGDLYFNSDIVENKRKR